MRVGIVLAGAVLEILAGTRVGSQFLQPFLIIGVQAPFVVVDGDAGSNVH